MSFFDPSAKYRPFPSIDLPHRKWPQKSLRKVPKWCSVDLRDGNQALIQPMNIQEKLKFFKLLVQMGFKEIEIGFPSASKLEYDFTRKLIEDKLIPSDVTLQVLTQAREPLIEKTYEALKGAHKAIIHLYNSTSELQRRVVFKKDRQAILQLAVQGAKWVKEYSHKMQSEKVTFEYSPESFTGTELDYALDVSLAVMDVWKPTKEHPMILNLPATVEMSSPNIYADQIEWMCDHLPSREKWIVSVHTHNDRGTAIAATELALLAGADRVEGTLFGNGERTGNCDLLTLALNFYSQGIHPKLNFHEVDRIIEVYETCTKLPIHPRHPYAGELVYTAFSGSHQDAIAKGMKAKEQSKSSYWEVPYLPLDPKDVGRDYESIIRINSQSGKGGAIYLLEKEFGFLLPKEMGVEFGQMVQRHLDQQNIEMTSEQVWNLFKEAYLEKKEPLEFIQLERVEISKKNPDQKTVLVGVKQHGSLKKIEGEGAGILEAFINGLNNVLQEKLNILDYEEHALGEGSNVSAVCYIKLSTSLNKTFFGIGVDSDIMASACKALISAYNRFKALPHK